MWVSPVFGMYDCKADSDCSSLGFCMCFWVWAVIDIYDL